MRDQGLGFRGPPKIKEIYSRCRGFRTEGFPKIRTHIGEGLGFRVCIGFRAYGFPQLRRYIGDVEGLGF